jgi:hypothetical protein
MKKGKINKKLFYIIIVFCIVFFILYHNIYFILFFIKNLLGKDFPIKEHDELNKFHDNPTNFVDDIYYYYCNNKLENLNKYHDKLPRKNNTQVFSY